MRRNSVALMLAAGLLTCGARAFVGTPYPEWVGKPMPDVQKLIGPFKTVNFQKSTLYTLILPDCKDCATQMAYFSELAARVPNMQVVIVTTSSRDNLVSTLLAKYRKPKPQIVLDERGKLIDALGLGNVPANVFVNAQGKVQGVYEGVLNDTELLKLGTSLSRGEALSSLAAPGSRGSQALELKPIVWKKDQKNLLVFHSAGCDPCQRQIPELLELSRSKPQLTVWVATFKDLAQVRAQYAGAPKNLQVVQVADKQNAYKSYSLRGTPTQILVGAQGQVLWRHEGYGSNTFGPLEQELTARR